MSYIDRDKAIAYVEEQYRLFKDDEGKQAIVEGCVEALKFTPTADVVEVVRCKDCKDYFPVMYKGEPMHYGFCFNTHDDVWVNRHRFERDFCSYGERRTG